MTLGVPDDLRVPGVNTLHLLADERQTLEQLQRLLAEDLRFEYLAESAARDATRRFVCLAFVQRKIDQVAPFVERHAREPMQRTCFFPLELLAVRREMTLYGVRLIPPGAIDMPAYVLAPESGPTTTSVVAIECMGSNYKHMIDRARVDGERALRLLRATLRAHHWLPDIQLRFRLGTAMWFDDSRIGWARRPGDGSELELGDDLVAVATSQPLSTLPPVPTNDVERRVTRALEWFERSQLADDPLMELLALFFALETILGDKSDGAKAPGLALRRAMLGLVTSGHFAHPSDTYSLYDEVRSKAVHGEQPPDVDQRVVDSLAWDVRLALNEYLQRLSRSS